MVLNKKAQRLMEEVILPYHPDFQTPAVRALATSHPELFNIELLVEHAMAAVGGYQYIDAVGQDFDDPDQSDCKTSTVTPFYKKSGRISGYKYHINNVGNKIGSLRIVMYNAVTDHVDYFYIPPGAPVKGRYAKKTGTVAYSGNYSMKYQTYTTLSAYQVPTFQEVACRMTRS